MDSCAYVTQSCNWINCTLYAVQCTSCCHSDWNGSTFAAFNWLLAWLTNRGIRGVYGWCRDACYHVRILKQERRTRKKGNASKLDRQTDRQTNKTKPAVKQRCSYLSCSFSSLCLRSLRSASRLGSFSFVYFCWWWWCSIRRVSHSYSFSLSLSLPPPLSLPPSLSAVCYITIITN